MAESPIGTSIIKALRFAPDGKSVATIYGDWVRIWDVATGRETRRLHTPQQGSERRLSGRSAQGSRSRPTAASWRRQARATVLIFLLDVASGRELGRLDGPESQPKALAFSPDGKILATGVDISQGFPES